MLLPDWIGRVAIGGCFGAVLGWQFLPWLFYADPMRRLTEQLGLGGGHVFWLGPVAGAAIGITGFLIGGPMVQKRGKERGEKRRRAAEATGAYFSATVDAELNATLQRDFGTQRLGMANVASKEVGGVRVAIGELTTYSSDNSVTQTAAHFASKDLRFPAFQLQPQGMLTKMLSQATGIQSISLARNPDFARGYFLTGDHPANVEALFGEKVVAWLMARPGVSIQAAGASLLLYRAGESAEEAQFGSLLEEAAEIFRLLEEAQRAALLLRDTVPQPKTDARAAAEKLTGAVGRVVRERLITRADVDAFARLAPPRVLPPNLIAYCDEMAPTMLIFIGVAFALAGGLFAMVFTTKGQIDGVAFGALFLAIGSAVIAYFGRTRWREVRLLRRGRLASARIQGMEDTGWSSSDTGQIYNARVTYQVDGQLQTATCKVTGHGAERVRKLAADSAPVRVLYYPADPQRVLLLEGLVNASPEYD